MRRFIQRDSGSLSPPFVSDITAVSIGTRCDVTSGYSGGNQMGFLGQRILFPLTNGSQEEKLQRTVWCGYGDIWSSPLYLSSVHRHRILTCSNRFLLHKLSYSRCSG
ncbi:Hypothetical predicted protein [Podarcis lilfordi]|uniref:Uncharacterized protein n=1 Tax=Podarcis lilfordi TaxID=74358 RepID=A0AA35NVK7_9SAUR|nr:Hypothetical predicted protein [Podarcis lilfordi]